MSRVGIYGGTFDPIHLGHLHVITQLFEKDLVDQLIVIPAGQPLLRDFQPRATGQQRFTMCELAVTTLPESMRAKVSVNPIEILRDGPSYAIDTVVAIQASFPNDQIFLVIGADAFEKINQWHRIDDLEKMVQIICINRPGYKGQGIEVNALEVSATSIREGRNSQVPEKVGAFIRENGLYDNQ